MTMMKKVLLGLAVLLVTGPAFAVSTVAVLDEILDNSKLRFLEASQIGYSWDISDENKSGAIALLDLLQYRFLILGAGWTAPYPSEKRGAVVVTAGIHLDKLARLIAPNAADTVKSVIPAILRPAWDRLTVSYGPGYNFDSERFTHLVSINFQFGQ